MENKYLCHARLPDVVYPSKIKYPKKSSIPFADKALKKSLEEIVLAQRVCNSSGQLENMFSDKAKSLKASVNALLEEIALREDLNAGHFKKIDGEVLRMHNQLMNLENICSSSPRNLTEILGDERARIEENVLELEKERRFEGLECWRDLMFLKKYLMRSLKDYWELVRKREVLGE